MDDLEKSNKRVIENIYGRGTGGMCLGMGFFLAIILLAFSTKPEIYIAPWKYWVFGSLSVLFLILGIYWSVKYRGTAKDKLHEKLLDQYDKDPRNIR